MSNLKICSMPKTFLKGLKCKCLFKTFLTKNVYKVLNGQNCQIKNPY